MRRREERSLQTANLYAEIVQTAIRTRTPLLPAVIVLPLTNLGSETTVPSERQASVTAFHVRIKRGAKNNDRAASMVLPVVTAAIVRPHASAIGTHEAMNGRKISFLLIAHVPQTETGHPASARNAVGLTLHALAGSVPEAVIKVRKVVQNPD
jgi:hypothetical protein